MLAQLHGRRTVLTGLLATVAALALSAPALAVTVTTANEPGASASATPPTNRTLNRSATIDVTVSAAGAGYAASCELDGVAYDCTATFPAGSTVAGYSFPGAPLSIGVHQFKITVSDTTPSSDTKTWVWRVEPPKYQQLITKPTPGHHADHYWNLDDSAGSPTAVDSTLGTPNNGEYKNYVVQRQPGLTACELQPAAPHSPWACDWLGGSPDNALLQALDSDQGNTPKGRDDKGYSAWFSGRDDHIQIENMPGMNVSRTVEAWVKPAFQQESRGIFQHTQTLWAEPFDANNMQFSCSALNDEPNAVVSAPIPNGTFNGGTFHVVCSYSAGVYKLWVNNVSSTHAAGTQPGGSPQGFIGLVNKTSGLWWKGYIDNVAYYSYAFGDDDVSWDWQTGAVDDTWFGDKSGLAPFPPAWLTVDQTPPSQSKINFPNNNAQYSADAKFSVKNFHPDPTLDFDCNDIDSTSALVPIAYGPNCYAEHSTDNATWSAIANGAALPLTAGIHFIRITASDGVNTYTHTHRYFVHGPSTGYVDLITCAGGIPVLAPPFLCDTPLAYWRLNEAIGATRMIDEIGKTIPNPEGNHPGDYKNDQDLGGTGVSGDGNKTRQFFGKGGYAAVNNLAAPLNGYTIELWWKPADNGDMMLFQHGSNGAIYTKTVGGVQRVYFRPDERSTSTAQSAAIIVPPAGSPDWYYVAATYDGIQGKLYVQKALAATVTLPAAATTGFEHWQDGAGSADTLYLGYGTELGGNGWLRGQLDEVAYYGTPLTKSKLTEHFIADPPAGDVDYALPSGGSGGSSGGSGGGGSSSSSGGSSSSSSSSGGSSSGASSPTPLAISSNPAAPSSANSSVADAKAARAAADAKARAKAKAKATAKAKARAQALARAKARAKAKAKARGARKHR